MSKPSKPIDLNDKIDKADEIGTLIVIILKAQNLNDKHSFRKSDVFGEAKLNGNAKRTHVDIKGGQRPEWDSELRFSIHKSNAEKYRKLEVACYSQEPRSEDLMGKGVLDITETLRTGEFDDWVPLEVDGVQRGEIYLELTYYANAPRPPPSKPAPNKMLAVVQNQNSGLTRRPSKLLPADRLSRPQPNPNQLVLPQNYYPTGNSPPQNISRLPKQHVPPVPPKDNHNHALPISLKPSARPNSKERADFQQVPPSYQPPTSHPGSKPGSQGGSPSVTAGDLPPILRPGPVQGNHASETSGPRPIRQTQSNDYGQDMGHGRHPSTSPPSNGSSYVSSGVGHYRTTSQGSNPYLKDDLNTNPYLRSDTIHAHSPIPPGTNYGVRSPPPLPKDGPPLIWMQGSNASDSAISFSFPMPSVSSTQDVHGASYGNNPIQTSHLQSNAGFSYQQHHERPAELDPYLQARYQSPLPLPPGAQQKPTPPTTVAPTVHTPAPNENIIPGIERAHIESLKKAEGEAARRREQELKDLELAMALDRELNLGDETPTQTTGASAARQAGMPGEWGS